MNHFKLLDAFERVYRNLAIETVNKILYENWYEMNKAFLTIYRSIQLLKDVCTFIDIYYLCKSQRIGSC